MRLLLAALLAALASEADAGPQCDALVLEADRAQAVLNKQAEEKGLFEPFKQRAVSIAYWTARSGDEERCGWALEELRTIK